MFMSAEGIRVMVLVANLAVVLLAGALVAHGVWVVQLARSPELAARSGPVRAAIVAAALATPVVGFYAAGVADLRQDRARGTAGRTVRRLALVVGATLALAGAGAVLVESRYAPEYRAWYHAARFFPGQAAFLLGVEALLFMIVRVLAAKQRPAVGIAFVATAAIFVVLFV